jgi:hypothetical protein
MLNRIVRRRESILDKPIERVLSDMDTYGPDSKEYSELIEHLDKLTKMKAEDRRNRVSPDTMAMIAGNLLGIVIIVAYEQKHVMTSKGLGFVLKARESH